METGNCRDGKVRDGVPGTANSGSKLAQDELDLVDLWLSVWSYRRLFLSTVLACVLIGVLSLEAGYFRVADVTVRSIIDIETTQVDGDILPVVSPPSLVMRIHLVTLPKYASLGTFREISPRILASRVDTIAGTNMVEIVSRAPAAMASGLIEFHNLMLDDVLSELRKSTPLEKVHIQDTIYAVKADIIRLQRMAFELEQNHDAVAGQREEIALRQESLESEIDILRQRAGYLESILAVTGSAASGSVALVRASAVENAGKLNRATAYVFILILAIFAGIIVLLGVGFAAKVKQRTG